MPIAIEFWQIERSDLSRTAYYKPAKDGEPAESPTMLEHINKSIADHGYWFGRKDIAVITVYLNGKMGDYGSEAKPNYKRIWLDPTSTGEPDWKGFDVYLTPAEKAWCRKENRKLIELERLHGWKEGTLTSKSYDRKGKK
jgi:hypothetical protein